ncbi:hypothetical protein [Stenotrophomonas sp. 24(2023)]|uniref:hypothetical protein n=1 Tax=Stenotrophomonas sp. 24(2023) TaxID=3068324 RepID=UPI0027DFFFBF|nr:hypothetical protein [Stenotrophomonas sp. 24(2023)]WMJ71324.1 hypothetical protein Q9R17_09580 [Stenotrophomonas sp. 24(2023)]
MPAGIQVFNADGSLGYDPQGRLFRVLARISYGSGNGSAGFSRQPEDTDLTPVTLSQYSPVFTINTAASIISWDFANVPANRRYGGFVEIWAR